MAVFTQVSTAELTAWLTDAKTGFNLGAIARFDGIASGIENSNFYLSTDGANDPNGGHYVLTIFEKLTAEQLPFYLKMMKHLASDGIACPDPLSNRAGALFGMLKGKPTSIATRLKGKPNLQPQAIHCYRAGELLAKMHLSAASFQGDLANLRGLSWWQKTVPQVLPFLAPALQQMLEDELRVQTEFAETQEAQALPRAAVHADFFRDNVLFDGEDLGGVFDFYFAGVDSCLFDLAVCANDWCIDLGTGMFDSARLASLIKAYEAVRPLGTAERSAWPMMQRAAALRFWVSRLYDFYLPRSASMLTAHDPTHFERILTSRRLHPHTFEVS
jgi:homoserine kinase type II